MEGNRDEAEKCIHIATKALEAGDREKALRFLNKAEKLYPTAKAKGGDVSYQVDNFRSPDLNEAKALAGASLTFS